MASEPTNFAHLERLLRSEEAHYRSRVRRKKRIHLGMRVEPRVRAIVGAIMERDQHPSLTVLFEEMLAAYMQIHGPIDESKLPSDEELVRRLEDERDKRDGE